MVTPMRRSLRWMFGTLTVLGLMLAPLAATCAHAQSGESATPEAATLLQATAAPVTVAAGGQGTIVVRLAIRKGWHVNANPPALEYNIPTQVTIAADHGLTPGTAVYPKGQQEKFEFDETPMLVYTDVAEVRVPFTASATATSGALKGQVRFQSCNNQVCLAPTSVPFTVNVDVSGAAAAPAPTSTPTATSAAPESGASAVMSAPPAGASSTPSPGPASSRTRGQLEQALAKGGLGWLLALFLGGLLLNLTPCVFPMLGVTVSIFGARAKEPLPKVFATAVMYVLGICVTYTALGVIAALTGGLFGSALQSVWVNLVLGGLMLVLSLSMFGLYEMQPPNWVMDRLGGAQATSFAGAFLSGLGVGVIAAPCVGPFVVAVLALVAQKHSVAFGVQTMFTLSLGLGFPYLFLATFSNLLQALPRSGDWMVWVKHLFGVIMASIGLYYLFIGFAPDQAPWVLPVALALGGLWLGFLDHSAGKAGAFKRATQVIGALALFGGILMGTQMGIALSRTLTWKPYSVEAVQASLKAGRPVMMDFAADWCVPCHELELNTFTDPSVVAYARSFDRYHVDLTDYDAPASEAARRQYGITGVPTVVFLDAKGQEVAAARVEGFLAPERFLQQMKLGAAR